MKEGTSSSKEPGLLRVTVLQTHLFSAREGGVLGHRWRAGFYQSARSRQCRCWQNPMLWLSRLQVTRLPWAHEEPTLSLPTMSLAILCPPLLSIPPPTFHLLVEQALGLSRRDSGRKPPRQLPALRSTHSYWKAALKIKIAVAKTVVRAVKPQ